MKFEIKNRLTGAVQFIADIEANDDIPFCIKVGLAVKKAVDEGADLAGADLAGAYLEGADLRGADLKGAYLEGAYLGSANLRCANLRGAYLEGLNFWDDVPVLPNIHQAVYKAASAPDALDMSSWHSSCGTTHCRAGWVVTLTGEAGRKLENILGTSVAAALIYAKSDPSLGRVPDFYTSTRAALTNMRELAEKEADSTAELKG